MMTTIPRLLVALFALLFGAGALTGCNTVRGAGEDIEAAGGAISDTAAAAEEELEDDDD